MRQGRAQPPTTDREARITGGFEVRVHWLQFSIMGKAPEDVESDLGAFIPGEFIEVEGGFSGYEFQKVNGPVRLLHSRRRPEVHVILTGEACDMVGGQELQRLLSYVSENGHPSRVDLAGDDFNHVVSPAEVRERFEAGEGVTHSARWRWYENDRGGTTFQMGSPSSRQQLRVYDKEAESSRGPRDAAEDGRDPTLDSRGVRPIRSIRWELQTRDDAAETLVQQLATTAWGDVFVSRLVQFVDFRDRSADASVTRCPRASWFEALVGGAKKALAYLPKPPRSVGEVDAWFRKFCAPMMAVLFRASGGSLDWFEDVAADGRRRWRGRHLVLVAAGTGGSYG